MGYGCLSCSRRPHQADDGRITLLGEDADGKKFQDSFLYLIHAVMVFIKHFLDILKVGIVLRHILPGYPQKCLYISPGNRIFRGLGMEDGIPVYFFFYFFFYPGRGIYFFKLIPEFIRLGFRVGIPQLLMDHTELLP